MVATSNLIPTPSTVEQDSGAAVISKITLRLVPFLFVLYIVAYLDRINVGFAKLEMLQQLGLSEAVYGFGAGIFFAGYFFFQLPSNLVLARVGARRWVTLLMVVWGAISCSMIFVKTAHEFYLLRFMLGAAEAGFFPGVILYLKSWFPTTARARTIAWFMTAGPLSGVVGGPISGAILQWHISGYLKAWQWLFLMEGGPAILLGLVVFVVLADSPQHARWLGEKERNWLLGLLEDERRSMVVQNSTMQAAFARPIIWLMVVMYFGVNTCAYGVSLWLPSFIRNLSGMSDFKLGLLSAVPYVATAITMVLVGFHSDRTGERRWHIALSAFCGMGGLLLSAFSHSLVPTIIGLSLGLMAVFSMCGPIWALNTGLSGTAAAAGIAIVNSVGNLGGFFGPSIIGFVQHRTALIIIGLLIGLGGCMALLVKGQEPAKSP
ncbi:MAG TPA: MFS transporter [Terriglobales bacterium]|nr:MFS transporter [Terriglobales bacterium]